MLGEISIGEIEYTISQFVDGIEITLESNKRHGITSEKMQQTQEMKLKWFRIRVVHTTVATNVVLMHMGI